MRQYWGEMCELFGILAYIVKESDPDGIEMYFTMSEKKHHSKNTTDLVDTAKARRNVLEGESNINVRLESILSEYNLKLQNQIALREGRSIDARYKDVRPLNVYIFTDAVWSSYSDPTPAIQNIVDSLVKLNDSSSRIGIQFISFGTDAKCLARLEHLDSGLGLKKYAYLILEQFFLLVSADMV
jgi:hypothetical protein